MRFHSNNTPGELRGWLRLALPTNVVCWQFGHFPTLKVYTFGSAGRVLKVECRCCGLPYREDRLYVERDEALHGLVGRERSERRKELQEARYDAILRNREGFLSDVSRRSGWDARETVWHYELIDHKAQAAARDRKWRWKFFDNLGFNLHFGNAHSETPVDANVQLGRWAAYFTLEGLGGRFATLVGRGHKRDLQLCTHSGQLWWKVWYDDDGGNDSYHDCDRWRTPKLWPWSAGRKKARAWMCLRDGNIELNPIDAFWGGRMYHYEKVGGERNGWVSVKDFIGDEYVVKFTLERSTRHRDHGPAWARKETSGWGAKWDAYECEVPGVEGKGIPIRNHEWKGDTVLSSSVGGIPAELVENDTWLTFAAEKVVEQIRRNRKHHGYQPPRHLRFAEQGAQS